MTTQTLDEVLAGADASEQDIANDTELERSEASQEVDGESEQNEDRNELDAHGALHAERQRVKRKYTDTVAEFDRKFTEATANFDKRLAEREEAINRQWEQRFNAFALQFQQKHQEPERPVEAPDAFDNPNGFLEHGISRAIDPVKHHIARVTETFSRRMAIKDHGEEKVTAAFQALDQAAKAGNRDAVEAVVRVKQSDDPFGDIVAWHQKSSVLSEFGTDPEAAIQKRLVAALEDPAFLAKAAEKLGVKPSAKPASQPLPSLNRVTAAADEDVDEEDAAEVFNTALRSGVRR